MADPRARTARYLSLLALAGLVAVVGRTQSCEGRRPVPHVVQLSPSIPDPSSAEPSSDLDRATYLPPPPSGPRATSQRPFGRYVPNGQPPDSAVTTTRPDDNGPRSDPSSAAARLPPEVQTAIPEAAHQPAPQQGEPALLEVQLGRLARQVLKVYAVEDQVLVPLGPWLRLAEIQHSIAGSRVTGRLQPARTPIVVDADSALARIGSRQLAVDSTDVRSIDGEMYGSLRLLALLFGVSAGVDRENAALVIHNPDGLPIARRMRREASRSIQAGGDEQVAAALIFRGPEETLPGLAAAYEVRGSSRPGAPTSYDVGVATGVFRGSAVLRAAGSSEAPPGIEGSWRRAWPDHRWLTQLRLGDGLSTGPRPQGSRGVSITNAPISRTVVVEDLPFAGTLPPDWSIEAYRAGRLVGFDSVGPSGKYSLTLPVHYGENPVDFVAYGPFGEVRTFNRTFRALPSMVPAGATEYAVSAGECRALSCDAGANLDLRYGVSRRWTLRAGVDQSWGGTAGALSHPYGGVVGSLTNSLGVELEGAANLLYRAGVRLEPSAGLRLTADYVSYADSSRGSPFLPLGTREQWSLYGRLMPGRRIGAVVLEAQATRTLTTLGARGQARAGAALQVQNMVLRPYVRGERLPDAAGDVEHGYLGLEATILPRRSLGPMLGGLWLQGRMEAEEARSITSAAVTVARNLGSAFRIEAGTRWERTLSGPVFMLSLVSQLDVLRSTSIVTASGSEPARLDQSVGGSVVWSSGRSAPVFSSEPSLDRGGVGGLVFIDLNADGRRQSNEPGAPGTRLLVGNRWVTAGVDGRYQVWGVSPWEEMLVSVDTASLTSPWWTPGFAAAAVMPIPNLVQSMDVPIIIGGVVEGSLLLDQPSSRLLERPLPIVLTHRESGTRIVLESFSDGSFYRMGMRPGPYEATVEDSVISRMGLRADTVRFELLSGRSATAPGATVSDLRILLRRREP
jgi:hypothetical protein